MGLGFVVDYKRHGAISSTFWMTKKWAMWNSTLKFMGTHFLQPPHQPYMGFLCHPTPFVLWPWNPVSILCKTLIPLLWRNLLQCCLQALLCFSHNLSMSSYNVQQDTSSVYALDHKFLVHQLSELKGASWYQRKEGIFFWPVPLLVPYHAWNHPLFLGPQF